MSQPKGFEFEPRLDHCVMSLSKALLYSTCFSQLSCVNEYQLMLGANLRLIIVLSRGSHSLISLALRKPEPEIYAPFGTGRIYFFLNRGGGIC